jgi:hypothetical protein
LSFGFGLAEKERPQAEACATKNKNASRLARRGSEQKKYITALRKSSTYIVSSTGIQPIFGF